MRAAKCLGLLVVAALTCAFKIDDAENKVIYGHDARLAIEAFGFSNVKIEGPALYGCGKDYSIATEFSALGPTKYAVKGVVCGGLIVKGWSVKIWEAVPPSSTNSP